MDSPASRDSAPEPTGDPPASGDRPGGGDRAADVQARTAAWPGQRWVGPRWLHSGWLLAFAFGVLFSLYNGLNAFIGGRSGGSTVAPWKPFVWEASSILVIVALIPLILRFEDRYRLDTRLRMRVVAMHALGALVFSAVHVTSMVGLRKLVYAFAGQAYVFGNPLIGGFYEFQKDAITYLIVLLAAFAMREYRVRREGELRATRLSAELSTARLHHLTSQIEPHFLFNSLNAISNRMREDVDAADRMVSCLADLLRAAYDTGDQVHVPLGSEVGWLRNYAAMMAERFRGQIEFDLDVEPGLESLRVPRLLLQPIVENAFRHGLNDGHGKVCVSVRRIADSHLCYTICDDGAGLPEAPMRKGTGLSNISRRLELIFGKDHELTFSAGVPRGTVVKVRFPAGT
jgi:two-component system, LytTR family, sensor kinase